MIRTDSHTSMFLKADNENGFIQCTIKPVYRAAFEALGFVDNADKLTEKTPAPAQDPKPETVQKESKKATKAKPIL